MNPITRRPLFAGRGAAMAASLLGGASPVRRAAGAVASSETSGLSIKKAVGYGMVGGDAPMAEKFALLKRLGFDGVELDSPNAYPAGEVVKARDESGLAVHSVVDSIHWRTRLSDPDPEVRAKGVEGLATAVRDCKAYGGSGVLLVPGRVADPERENQQQVWDRSIEGIRKVLPLAAELGIPILIENVWNGFCYDHGGGDDQSAQQLADYVDAISSPWVGAYFDIGNHRKYARPQEWIRTLGRRIVKLHVKDWGRESGWSKIGEGDVDWPAVCEALREIGFTGWATAEVGGGDEARLADIKARMDRAFGG